MLRKVIHYSLKHINIVFFLLLINDNDKLDDVINDLNDVPNIVN